MADKDSEASDAGLLRGWRKRLGLTQAAAAERLGLHVASLKNIEGGKRNVGRAVRILMDAVEPGSAKAAPKRTRATQVPDPAPIAAPNPMDAELVEVGRRYAKVGAAFVSAALVGGLTADLIAEMAAARKEVHRMQALGGSPFSETAMSVFGAFILSSNAAQRALKVALEAGVEEIAQAVDMRNFTLSDVSPTLLAGGQGISLNSVHGVLLGRQPRQGTGGTPEKTEPPAFPEGLTLTSADGPVPRLRAERCDILRRQAWVRVREARQIGAGGQPGRFGRFEPGGGQGLHAITGTSVRRPESGRRKPTPATAG